MKPYYQDQFATIYHGDMNDILPTLPPVDAVITDPPYGINYSPGGGGGGIKDKNGNRYPKGFTGKDVVFGDDKPFEPSRILAIESRVQIFWGGNHFAERLPSSSCWLVWDKRCGTTTNDFADCEIAWTNIDAPARVFRHLWNGMLKDSERGVQRFHPTQKPVAVMAWCIQIAGDIQTIIDPFMGSGTTLVAAKQLGKIVTGIEINEKYCEIAAKRLQQEYLPLVSQPTPKAVEQELL